jgi:hypothetical protein
MGLLCFDEWHVKLAITETVVSAKVFDFARRGQNLINFDAFFSFFGKKF